LRDKDNNAYTVVADFASDLTPPEGYGENEAILIAGQSIQNWIAEDGRTVLIRAKDADGKIDFYLYDESLNLLKLYVTPIRFQTPSRIFEIIVDPDEIGEVPEGFVEATVAIGGQAIPAWKHQSAKSGTYAFGVYLLYLRDEFGQGRFYLFDEKTSDIMDFDTLQKHGLLAGSDTGTPTPSVTPTTASTPTPTPRDSVLGGAISPTILIVLAVLAAICVGETAYIVWSLIERRKGRPRIRRV